MSQGTNVCTPVESWLEQWQALQSLVKQQQHLLDSALSQYQLNAQTLLLLYQIHKTTRITQIDLARCLQVSPGVVCNWIEKLTAAGWLQVTRSLEDRRCSWCELTVEGRARYLTLLAQLQPLALSQAPAASGRRVAA